MTQQNCPCFCPTADTPVAPILVPQGGPGEVFDLTLYGTQGFSASIVTNAFMLPSNTPVIALVQIVSGNILRITTGSPDVADTIAGYDVMLRVCNACGTLDIPIRVDVVADLNPIVTNCLLAQALWTPEARIPTVGDTLLAFTPLGCRALLPPPPPDTCADIQAFPGVVPTLVTQLATADCGLATVLDVLALYDLCADLNTFSAGAPPSPVDRFISLQGASCVTVTGQQITDFVEANIDLCTMLQNFPNAVVQPTAVFYGQQAGACFEFAVADLAAAIGVGFPMQAPDGSCAAPSYSFASDTAGGMWFDPAIGPSGAVVISDHNCTNRINVGASIQLSTGAISNINLNAGDGGNVNITTANGVGFSPGSINLNAGSTNNFGAQGGIVSITGGNSSGGFGIGGDVSVSAGHGSGGSNGGQLQFQGGSTDTGIGGSAGISGGAATGVGGFGGVVQFTGGTATAAGGVGGNVDLYGGRHTAGPNQGSVRILTGAAQTERLSVTGTGEWSIGGSPGAVGEVITSNGPGLPPSWQAAGGGGVALNDVQNATGAASRDHGSNTIQWDWDFEGGNRFQMHDNTNGDDRFIVGVFSHLSGRRGDGSVTLQARSAAGAPQAQVIAQSHITQPNASMSAFIGGQTATVEVRTTGVSLSTTGANGIIHDSANHTFRTAGGLEQLVVGTGLGVFGASNFVRIDRAAPGGSPTISAMGNPDANVDLTLVPKGTGTIRASVFTVTADNGERFSGQTSGAGANAGTLANAPSAGNPAFWLRVVINGVNHFIPAWT